MNEPKSERIDIRTTATTKAILQQAAAAMDKTVSEFLLESGLQTATKTLTDRTLFGLNNERWEQFQQALDQPATVRLALKKLLTEPGVFD